MMNKHGGDIYGYPGVVDFSANINYLGMPQAVKAAAMRGVEESIHYPQVAHRQLRHAVAERYHIEEEQILCGNGAAELIYCLVEALPTFIGFLQLTDRKQTVSFITKQVVKLIKIYTWFW